MDTGHETISKAACRLAAELPLSTLQIVARIIGTAPSLPVAKTRMVELPQPHHRQLAAAFIDHCAAVVPQASPQIVAMSLFTAGTVLKTCREEQAVELVWTGPDVGAVPFRRTEQAILEVLDSVINLTQESRLLLGEDGVRSPTLRGFGRQGRRRA